MTLLWTFPALRDTLDGPCRGPLPLLTTVSRPLPTSTNTRSWRFPLGELLVRRTSPVTPGVVPERRRRVCPHLGVDDGEDDGFRVPTPHSWVPGEWRGTGSPIPFSERSGVYDGGVYLVGSRGLVVSGRKRRVRWCYYLLSDNCVRSVPLSKNCL